MECPYCRWSIASYLESIGQQAVEPLLEAQNSKDIYVQNMARRILAKLDANADYPQPVHA